MRGNLPSFSVVAAARACPRVFASLKAFFDQRAGDDVVGALAFAEQVHRDHRELLAGAALQQQDLVVVGHGEQLAHQRQRLLVHSVVGLATMAVLDDAHARTLEVEKLALRALESGQRKCRRACVEVHYSGHDPPVRAKNPRGWATASDAMRQAGRASGPTRLAEFSKRAGKGPTPQLWARSIAHCERLVRPPP